MREAEIPVPTGLVSRLRWSVRNGGRSSKQDSGASFSRAVAESKLGACVGLACIIPDGRTGRLRARPWFTITVRFATSGFPINGVKILQPPPPARGTPRAGLRFKSVSEPRPPMLRPARSAIQPGVYRSACCRTPRLPAYRSSFARSDCAYWSVPSVPPPVWYTLHHRH